jgi:hypothetical protein
MSSSVRSRTPRPANVRTNSSTSIHIDREVSVVTSAADGSNKKPIYSTMPPVHSEHRRAQSSHEPNTATVSNLIRWKSMSRMSETSRFTHQGAPNTELASNKESMRALAEFLIRSEPPLTNFMSQTESDAANLHPIKNSALRIFGRQKSKKTVQSPKLLQLPDSAVAATTINGVRHIAISIPLEYDYLSYDTPTKSTPPSARPQSQPRLPGDRGPITVLKPVVEVRESAPSNLNNTKTKNDEERPKDGGKRLSRASVVTPAAEVLGPETTTTLGNFSTELNQQQTSRPVSSNAEGKLAVKPESATMRNSFVAVSPVNVARQNSTLSDPRHSGGTAYSTASIGSYPAHSRGPSSASSAPSAVQPSGFKVELPPRNLSTTKLSPTVQTELAQAYLANKAPAIEDTASSSLQSEKSAFFAGESTPGVIIGIAETAQSYNAAVGIQTISRSNTPKNLDSIPPSSPAPTRQLPDLPESPCVPSFMPSPSPPIAQKNSPTTGAIDDASSKGNSTTLTKSPTNDPRQIRQDSVKARKQRDVAIHRDKSITQERAPLVETLSSTNTQMPITAPAKSQKRRSISQEVARKRGFNSISEVMLVADLAPYTGVVKMEDLPFVPSPERTTNKRVKDTDSNGNMSARGTHTPPSSAGTETDSVVPNRRLLRSRGSSRNVGLDARRQDRRLKRNMSLREKEMDARLGKLERDNTMLMTTLSGIATSFGELSRVLPRARVMLREPGMLTDVEREMRDGGDEKMVRGERKAEI